MSRLRAFGVFWYRFLVGDDWTLALAAVAGVAATAALAHGGRLNAWWLLPVVVGLALTVSLLAAARHRLDKRD